MKINKNLIIMSLILIFCISLCLTSVTGISVDNKDYTNEVSSSDINVLPKDCCSLVIQKNKNESIFAFRQDSPITSNDSIRIESQNWKGYNLLKQRINSDSFYFFHSIILENGWVISQGGSQYGKDSKIIENITLNMMLDNEISNSSLEEIRKVLIPHGYGHVFIKAPDGRYGVVFVNRTYNDVLKPDEYLVIPNEMKYYDKGNYKSYSLDPVQAIIEICSWDKSGENVRDQMIYHYKPQLTLGGFYYGVDTYVTNCNGVNIGLNKSDCVVPFYYGDKYYPTSVIPEYPNKLYVGNHIFKNKSISVSDLNNPVNDLTNIIPS